MRDDWFLENTYVWSTATSCGGKLEKCCTFQKFEFFGRISVTHNQTTWSFSEMAVWGVGGGLPVDESTGNKCVTSWLAAHWPVMALPPCLRLLNLVVSLCLTATAGDLIVSDLCCYITMIWFPKDKVHMVQTRQVIYHVMFVLKTQLEKKVSKCRFSFKYHTTHTSFSCTFAASSP